MKVTALIMAGGKGERFWPKSRAAMPKQFLSLTSDGETLIRKTVNRIVPLVAPEDIFVVTNAAYHTLVAQQLPEIPEENILYEPVGRNTAPCIGLAAMVIRERYGDAVMTVLPSDHLIRSEDRFRDTLRHAARVAEDGKNLVTLGITPTYPETGFGYIKYVTGSGQNGVYRVEGFVEKPNLATARGYVKEGSYLWNSGMFLWKASSILDNIHTFLPEVYSGLEGIMKAYGTGDFAREMEARYGDLPSESIDFGVMEKARDILTIPGSFGWDDAGSWLALERINATDTEGNMLSGDVVCVDSRCCTVCAESRTVAVLGLEDMVVVDTPDALLVCNKNSSQDIRRLLTALREQGKTALL